MKWFSLFLIVVVPICQSISGCGPNIPEHIEVTHNVPEAQCTVDTLEDGTVICYCTLGTCIVVSTARVELNP